MADAVAAYFDPKNFASIEYGSHSIAEDGDTQYDLLLARRQDGSYLTVTSSDFPF